VALLLLVAVVIGPGERLEGGYWSLEPRINVRTYGATGDGVTNDLTAFQNALAAAAGGTLYIPGGTYRLSKRLAPVSSVRIVGDGIGNTILKNDGTGIPPDNIAIDIRGTLGVNYAINSTTEGASTVTTTTAANAGHFTAGANIALSGELLFGDYVPFWLTTVISVNSGTGVITLTDRLPRADYTLVHQITALPRYIEVADLTIAKAGDVGLLTKYTRDVRVERVQITSGVQTVGLSFIGSRDQWLVSSSREGGTGGLVVHSTTGAHIRGNVFARASSVALALEGGVEGAEIVGNSVIDPGDNGIQVNTNSRRALVLGNSVLNVRATGTSGVLVDGTSLGHGDNVVAHNTITAAQGTTPAYGVAAGTSNDNVIAFNRINGPFDTSVLIGTKSLRQVVEGNRWSGYVRRALDVVGGGTVAGPAGGRLIAPISGAAVTINNALGDRFVITVTSANAFTISAPTTNYPGQRITIRVRNASGGAMGTITWGWGQYAMAPWTNPANGFNRAIEFIYNASLAAWVEASRTPEDVLN
jgi:hypothetical protein